MSLALAGSVSVDADVDCSQSSDSTHAVQVANRLMLSAMAARSDTGRRRAVMDIA